MTSLAHAHQQLEQHWRRTLRRTPPWPRWAAHDRRLDIDEAQLRHTLDQRDLEARDRFRSLVQLAVAGDQAAATLLELVMLPKMVRVERRRSATANAERYAGGYSPLAGTLWEAIVTTRNIDQRWLREDIERRAWRLLYKGHTPTRERHHIDVEAVYTGSTQSHGRSRAGGTFVKLATPRVDDGTAVIDAKVTWEQTFAQLAAAKELTNAGRQILERIMSGEQQPIARYQPGGEAAKKQRERTIARIRTSQIAASALIAS